MRHRTGIAALIIVLSATPAIAQSTVTGIVYHDANENQTRDTGETGLENVHVSNGREVATTDSDGRYNLPIGAEGTIFVIKPTNWRTHIDPGLQLPHFYYTHKPEGSPDSEFPGVAPTGALPASVDFPLYPNEEPDMFKVIFFGDPQPRNVEEVNYIAHDMVQELVGAEAAFGVTLGDIVFDDLDVFPYLNGVIGRIGVPWYNVIGNHDLNMDTDVDALSDETFERIYGPNYYAYNYGGVHFIVLDDVAWEDDDYHGEIGPRQLKFVANDLATVSPDTLVVLMMHIPLVGVDDRQLLLGLLQNHPHNFSISAHWHRQGHFFMTGEESGEPLGEHHHLVHGTTSGSWWSGAKDEWGIPHTLMRDGTPNGYSIATFSGTDYSLRYKASRRPPDFQMSIYAPSGIKAAEAADTEVVVNVFMGSEKSTVEMRLGDTWIPMQRTEREDVYYQKLKELEPKLPEEAGRKLPDIVTSPHIWTAKLPANPPVGTHIIYVRTTDVFGQTFKGARIIRVE